MPDVAHSELFPLPLVPFEQYMLRDDTSEYPMTFCLEFDFLGEFDRMAFDESLAEALRRHPLFGAVVQRRPRKGNCWVAVPGLRVPLDWGARDAPLDCPGGDVIDLRREAGLRLWVRQGDGRARLTLQIHHACTDAIGVLHFVGDLLASYAGWTGADGKRTDLVPLDPAALGDRSRFNVEPPEPVSQWQILNAIGTEAAKFFGRAPAPLAIPAQPRATGVSPVLSQVSVTETNTVPQFVETDVPLSFPGICSHTFDAETTAALRGVAARCEATLNDVLLRDAFRLAADWNTLHEPQARRRWLRINMPTNLRGRNDRPTPAANMMSYTFLDRRPGDCRDCDGLLRGIRRETELIKYWSMGLLHLGGLHFLLKVPGLFRLATGRRCLATLVLSNVGDPARHFRTRLDNDQGRVRAGNVVLERLTGAPPVRPLTRATLIVSCYVGQLTLGLRCDRRLFTLGDARALLARYVELLDQTAASL